jgi:hypothetical protein
MEARLSVNGTAVTTIDQLFQAVSASSHPQRHFNGTADLEVLLEPGDVVNVFLFRNGNAGSSGLNFARVMLRGYLVDAN